MILLFFTEREKYIRLCVSLPVRVFEKRISGPLPDRIDIHIELPRVNYERLNGDRVGESSETIRARVQAAREIQNNRFSKNGSSDIICNADIRLSEILSQTGKKATCEFCREEIIILNKGIVLCRACGAG